MAKTWDEIVAERKKKQASAKTWDDIVRERGGTTKKAENAAKSKLGQVFDRPGSGVSASMAAPKKTMAEQMAYAGSRDRELRTAEIVKSKTSAPTDSTQKTASVPYMPGYTQFKQAQTVYRNAKAQAAQEAERQTVYDAAAREIAARRTAGGNAALLASPENRQSLRAATPAATRKTAVLPADMPKYANGMPTQETPKTGKARYLGKSAVAGLMDTAADLETGAQLPQRLSDRRAKTYLQHSGADYDTMKTQEILSDKNTAVEDARDSISQELAEEGQALGAGWQTAGALTRGTTHMLPTMALGLAGGGTLGTAAMSTLAGVGSAQQALKHGATAGQALAYGVGSGLLSYGTERMFGGIPGFGKGGAEGLIKRILAKSGLGTTASAIVKRGADIIGEGLEEFAEDLVQPTLQRSTYDKNAKDATWQELLQSFLMGSAMSMVLGGPADVKTAWNLSQNTDDAQLRKVGNELIQAGQQDAVIAAGLAAPEGSAARTMAETLQAQRNAGKAVSAADLGGLILENIREVSGKAAAEAETGALTNIPAGAVDARAGNMVEYQKAGGEVYGSEGQTRNTGVGEAQTDAGAAGEGGLDHAQFQDHPETVPVGERNNPQHGREGIYGTADGGLVRGNGPLLVRPEITEQFKAHNIDTYPMQGGVDGAAFSDAIKTAKAANPHGAYVTAYDAEHYVGNRNFLGDNGNAGASVTPDGDIISVFKSPNSKARRAITQLLLTALENGGVKLDNFDGQLSDFYMRHGFVPVARTAFNPEFAPPDWNYERDGQPDIVFWAHNGDTSTEVLDNYGGYNYQVQDAPVFADYDSAAAHRDSVIGQVRQERQAEKQNTQAAGSSPAASSLESAPPLANPAGSPNVQNSPNLADFVRAYKPGASDEDVADFVSRLQARAQSEREGAAAADTAFIDRVAQKTGVKFQVAQTSASAGPRAEAYYDRASNTVLLSPEASRAEVVRGVVMHELTHAIESSESYTPYRLYVMGRLYGGKVGPYQEAIRQKQAQYAAQGVQLDEEGAVREIVADYTRYTLFADEDAVNQLAEDRPVLARRVLGWIRDTLKKVKTWFTDRDAYDALRTLEHGRRLFSKALGELDGTGRGGPTGVQASIRTADNGEKYVLIDRNVFTDESGQPLNQDQWAPALKIWVIQNLAGKSITAEDGTVIDITAAPEGRPHEYNTADKIITFNKGMNPEQYRTKLQAAQHLDELAEVSSYRKSAPDWNNKHREFAKDGWEYRRAYFTDGKDLYIADLSVAKSGGKNVLYNIGAVRKTGKYSHLSGTTQSSEAIGANAQGTDSAVSDNTFRTNSIPASGENSNPHILQNNDTSGGGVQYALSDEDFENLYQQYIKQYGAFPQGENPRARDVEVPARTSDKTRTSRWSRTVIESPSADDVTADNLKHDIVAGKLAYVPTSDKAAVKYANAEIRRTSFAEARDGLRQKIKGGEAIRKEDIALGERLIQLAIQNRDYESARNLIIDVSLAGTEMGKSIQAMHLLKQMTPEGELAALHRTVERMNSMPTKQQKKARTELSDADQVKLTELRNDASMAEKTGSLKNLQNAEKKARDTEKRLKDVRKREATAKHIRTAEQSLSETEQAVKRAQQQYGAARTELDRVKTARRTLEDLHRQISKMTGEMFIPQENIDDILSQTTREGLDAAVERAQAAVALQAGTTWQEKVNAWRYTAMLANPRTHIRNFLGNAVQLPVRKFKNLLAVPMEKALIREDGERTKAVLTPKDKSLVQYARKDFEQNAKTVMSGGKYDMRSAIEQQKRIFAFKPLEALRKGNSAALEWGDMVFLRGAYVNSLAEYMKANGYAPESITDEQLQKGQNYATQEAQKATYRDFSELAQMLNRFSKNHKIAGTIVEGVLPFKKTPINILKRGVEYSPAGIAKGLYDAVFRLKSGKVSASQVIDEISAGLAGSAIMALGYFLAGLGWLEAGEHDPDRKAAFDRNTGSQEYAIRLPGGSTYTIDWMSPPVLPLMVGAELYNAFHNAGNTQSGLERFASALPTVIDPIFNMTMLEGVTSTLRSYSDDNGEAASQALTKALTNYAGQFVPTIGGQIARTIDPTRRTSKAYASGSAGKTLSGIGKQTLAKMPGASGILQPVVNQRGEEVRQPGKTWVERLALNTLSPGTYRRADMTDADREIKRLYESTGETGVLPRVVPSSVSYNSVTYRLDDEEATQFSKTLGRTAYEYIDRYMKSSLFEKAGDARKTQVFKDIMDNAYTAAKNEFLTNRNVPKKGAR